MTLTSLELQQNYTMLNQNAFRCKDESVLPNLQLPLTKQTLPRDKYDMVLLSEASLVLLSEKVTLITIMIHVIGSQLIQDLASCFLGSWGMNRSAGQTKCVNCEAVLGRFVCSALQFIPHEPRNKRPKGPHNVHLSTMCYLFDGSAKVAIFVF